MPGTSGVMAQRHDIAADVDERILDAVLPKNVRRAIERVAFRVPAEVELHGRVSTRHGITPRAQIAHARVGTNDSGDFFRVRQRPSGFVSVKTPQSDQLADARVE